MEHYKFSPLETEIIRKVKRRKKIKLTELAEKIYKRPKMNEAITIGNAIGRINKKCKLYHLNWAIGGEGLGRNGKTVWMEKAKRRSAST